VDHNAEHEAVAKLLDVVSNLVEMLAQAAQRRDVDLTSLKSQCLDLILEAIAAAATKLSSDISVPAPLRERSSAVVDRLAAFQRSFVDVRLHLIDLAEGWQCSACGRDVAGGAAVVSKSPLVAVLVCKACGVKSPLTPRGEQRLQELFGTLASAAWDPALNRFIV
jgi:3-dehydroquinate dehydratase